MAKADKHHMGPGGHGKGSGSGGMTELPDGVLGERRELALLFKTLATLRSDAPLFDDVEALRWRGPTDAFAAWTERAGVPKLLERCLKAAAATG